MQHQFFCDSLNLAENNFIKSQQWPKHFKYVHRFEIGHREGGEKIGHTDGQTHPVRDFNKDSG